MARQCDVCGKGRQLGNQVTTRGKKKYLGGVGTKVTGISRRKFKPNLQRVKVSTANGTHKAIHVCTQCLRSGAITKVVRAAPFKVPHEPAKAK
jgi:large subunit ribosomal protein L28